MDNFRFPEDDISILDEHVESGAISADSLSSGPEFQIYSNRPRDVDDASHYALRLTCQTLQKRNRELEHQLVRLQKMYSKHPHVSKLEPNNSSLLASGTNPDGSHLTVENYAKHLEKRVAALECDNAKLASELKREKSVVSDLEELLGSLDLNMDGFTTGNSDLDVRLSEKYKELKARKDSSTMGYEHRMRQVKERERTDECKFDFIEQMPSEHLRYSDGTHSKSPAKGDSFSADLLELIKQLNALKQTVLLQSSVIKQLLQKKVSAQLRDKKDESVDDPVGRFQSDFSYSEARRLPNYEQLAYSFGYEAAFPPADHEPVRLNNDTEQPSADYERSGTAYPADTSTARTQAVVRPDLGDNRLYVAGLSQQARTIEIERNINSAEVCSPRNHAQNVNLTEMTREKQTGLDDRQQVVMNNDPLVGTKHIPAHNISASKTCPLCEQIFPAEMKQADFEYHVHSCLRRSQSDAAGRPMLGNDEDSTTDMRECPVCNVVLPPDTCQSEFELHVNSHFDSETEPIS